MPDRSRQHLEESSLLTAAPDRGAAADGRRRAVVERVIPEIDGGRFPIKRAVGEFVQVTAWAYADGHDVLAVVLRSRAIGPDGRTTPWHEQPMAPRGNDEWTAIFEIRQHSTYEYTVEAWVDRFATWRHELVIKSAAGQDITSELLEGAVLIEAVAGRARAAGGVGDAAHWLEEEAGRLAAPTDAEDRARRALEPRLAALARQFPDRSLAYDYPRVLRVEVDRERARFGAWYEMFPRSWGPDPTRSATFREAAEHLPRVASMGFDVLYLPPIHPIGLTARKGPGNTLGARDSDPGSPWAIGSADGGHKAVHPDLGSLEDFAFFVAEARRHGLEIALDVAFQCSPDHPYVDEHPEWFRRRPDGSIKHAENPPKKYQDIVPFDFESEAWPALWQELKSIVEFWIARGVTIFRVDNPHTKPFAFWEWLIGDIRRSHPDVVFLSEAFTRPKVMYCLAKLGFTQSYTYFTWRNTKDELTEYFTELTQTEVAEFFRPNLFANTPDILHAYLQQGGPAAFKIRLVLAATLGASYGIYSGFELCEHRAVPGTEEYAHSEKYQYRRWDSEAPGHISDFVSLVNRVRRENPAFWHTRNLVFCETDNPHLLAYCKVAPDRSSAVLTAVNLDPARMQHGMVQVPLDLLGLLPGEAYEVVDLLDGARYTWRGDRNYVRLDPFVRVAHLLAMPIQAPDVAAEVDRALGSFLAGRRWFAGKARTVSEARLLDWSPYDACPGGLTLATAEVTYADGVRERYFTPLALVPEAPAGTASHATVIARSAGFLVVDAIDDDVACRALLASMLKGRPIEMRSGLARPTLYRQEPDAGHLPILRGADEQSNSSLRFGDRYVLKLFRRLTAGPHPELEVTQFLTERRFRAIAPLVASLDYDRPDEESAALAVLQAFVPNNGTGWDEATADLRACMIPDEPGRSAAESFAFLGLAARLGRRTAEMHLALSSGWDNPAFTSEPMTTMDAAELSGRLRSSLARVLSLLANRIDALDAPAREPARTCLNARHRLEAMTEVLPVPPGLLRTRVHGDYHLGQVLSTGQDFVIIDFEGEPARPLAERRAKQSPLKDVAGMLRSFSYAGLATVREMIAAHPDAATRFELRTRVWEASVSTAFLAQYRQTTAGSGLVPADDAMFARWLAAYLLEKALYEVEYELASRPHWVGIPLQGVMRILKGWETGAEHR